MDTTEVPNLPGYGVSYPIRPPERGFGRSQSLHYNNGFAIEEPVNSSTDCVDPVPHSSQTPASSVTPPSTDGTVKLPKWVEMDRKVLRYYGYFEEAVDESPIEDHRIRRVTLYYYLADDTIHVEEPRQDNSGLTQGIFVRRHRIPKPDGAPYSLEDIRVGETVGVYGRKILIVDCDDFTRSYLKEHLSCDAPAAIPYPTDPIDVYRIPPNPRNDSLTRYLEAKLGKPSNVLEKDTLRKFLDNNRMVLRFWCVWDDRSSLFGQRRPYALHYFLEDDTGEILECFETNSGRDPFPVFQKRGPLIKGYGFTTLGESSKGRQIYTPRDIHIGGSIFLNSRQFFVYDCDDFTREWYKNTYGASDEELEPVDVSEGQKIEQKPSLPPHNGFGSREDSQQNCVMLVPKPPKKDFLKLMNKDSIVLRFAAALQATKRFQPSEEDAARSFVVTYFMADDTIAIFERPLKNSGLVGGKFLERSKIRKPDSDEPYTYRDLYVGAAVDFHRRGFLLLDADEYTYTYMENNKHVFNLADGDSFVNEIRGQSPEKKAEIRSLLERCAAEGEIGPIDVAEGLSSMGLDVVHHQAIALQRKISKDTGKGLTIESLLAALDLSE